MSNLTAFPNGIIANPIIGGTLTDMFSGGNGGSVYFVDGDNGNDGNMGKSPDSAFKTIQAAVTAAATNNLLYKTGSTVYVKAKYMSAGSTDPSSYAETIIIPAAGGDRMNIIGVGNRTQGGLPQIKKGSGSAAQISIKAPGCSIINIGINGTGATGGGITLYDDGGATTSSFGTSIIGCHFKNCVGSTATDSRTGGAINLGSVSGDNAPWQVRISGNIFYKNVGGVVLVGAAAIPQDILIENNTFMGTAATVDSCIYTAAGSGIANITVNNNTFAMVKPALGSGSVARYVDMTGCVGIFSNNYVASTDTTTGFGAAKATAKIPTTVGISHNYSDGGLIVREA